MSVQLRIRAALGALGCCVVSTACSSIPERGTAAPADSVVALVRETARPVTGAPGDYDSLMALIGDARFVLLGEATHGTHEFYRERARITLRLIEDKGFTAIALEADWTNAYRINQYVRGTGGDASAEQALSSFTDFPHWMWRNTDVRDLVQWLRTYNDAQPTEARAGVYGLDLYTLWASADAVVQYLEQVDPAAAERARQRYACFAPYRDDPGDYGFAVASNPEKSCADEAVEQLEELQQRSAGGTDEADSAGAEALFSALQNARVVKNGEEYYRISYTGGMSSWNLRDRHMAETLDELARHLDAQGKGRPAKVVVWAHNTHVGDARMTEMGESGELNVGQLMRQRHDASSVLVGFTTYTGTVFAAAAWGESGRVEPVRPALKGSYSALFHATGVDNFLLVLRGGGALADALAEPRLERAIGVVYLPHSERESHYFRARLSQQFDAVVHFDETRAVEPLLSAALVRSRK